MAGRYYYAPVNPGYDRMAAGIMQGLNGGIQGFMAGRQRQDDQARQDTADARAAEAHAVRLHSLGARRGQAPTETWQPDDLIPTDVGPRESEQLGSSLVPEPANMPRFGPQVATDMAPPNAAPRFGTDWLQGAGDERLPQGFQAGPDMFGPGRTAEDLAVTRTAPGFTQFSEDLYFDESATPLGQRQAFREEEAQAKEAAFAQNVTLIDEAIRVHNPDMPEAQRRALSHAAAQHPSMVDDLLEPPEEATIQVNGRKFPDSPEGYAQAEAWQRRMAGARRAPGGGEERAPRGERRQRALTRIDNMLRRGAPASQVAEAMATYDDLEGVWSPDDVVAAERTVRTEREEDLSGKYRKPATPVEQTVYDELLNGKTPEQVLQDVESRDQLSAEVKEEVRRYLKISGDS